MDIPLLLLNLLSERSSLACSQVTTPDDMSVAEGFLKDHHKGAVVHA